MNAPSRSAMSEAINHAAADLEVFHKEPSAANEARALRAAAELIKSIPAPRPPEPLPWLEVVADPRLAGRHPLHDCRYIITKGAELFEVRESPSGDSTIQITGGSIVATMTDCERQRDLAYVMAAGPDLLQAAKEAAPFLRDHVALSIDQGPADRIALDHLEAAIAKASGPV